ncbi:RNA-binding protein CP31B, chloroplastic [Sesamum alatum]|uniref:RNA-binding protein CP31B, chloroplastic n=1 Tax=Sesamum alatum TaxID=300844 RepID=A0AAE2CTQ6_9LAMI|nr:RNA-binding protein CP31B, chloroplastic [Sesamum alatum]
MAAFRLIYFPPAAAQFSHNHLFLPSPPPPNHPCLISLTSKHRRSNLQLFLAQVQVQAQPTIKSETANENAVEQEEEEEVSKTRLLVQNVPWTCSVDDIRPLFENYGTVVDIEFSMYNKTKNRGLAFVTMGSHEEALAALNNLESTEFQGRVLNLNWAKPKKKKPSSLPQPKPMPVHNLFVANLPFQAMAKDLKDFFNADNANVVSAEVIFQENPRRSAGYGFVSFNTKAEAEAALAAFQGKEFMGRAIRVARSRRFLRQETKSAVQSESAEFVSAADVQLYSVFYDVISIFVAIRLLKRSCPAKIYETYAL